MTDVTMPQLGETVTEGTITRWYKEAGEEITVGEVLFEVSTDKVDSEVPSLVAGVLQEVRVPEGETVPVGAVLATIAEAGYVSEPAPAAAGQLSNPPSAEPAMTPASDQPPADHSLVLSPVVRRLISENNLDASNIVGTGPGRRIARSDVQEAIIAAAATNPPDPVAAKTNAAAAHDTVIPMNHIRKRTAEHMMMTKATSPHVLTAVEVDFERVDHVRRKHKANWKREEGFSLTYLPFICRAVVDALHEYPQINASVGDGELIVHHRVNLAIAVDLDFSGLLAPVVDDANSKRLRALARDIADLAARARSKKLSADEISGGTFTITNPGQYGTHMQFPLINQPQVAILSTDGIRRRPVAVTDQHGNEAIAIHATGILSLGWDHRAFDGAYVAAFLDELRKIIETQDWEAEIT